jgi:Ca2+-binding RTX toxin-like protein
MSTVQYFVDGDTLRYDLALNNVQGLVYNTPVVTSSTLSITYGAFRDEYTGSFVINSDSTLGGAVSGLNVYYQGVKLFSITGLLVSARDLYSALAVGNIDVVSNLIVSAVNQYIGSPFSDAISTTNINSTVNAGAGNDNITAGNGSNYLRGDDGNDSIQGGTGFDDANGNAGNDTIHGGAGDDWSVGGKDNDFLFGDDGNDIVWGNLGDDTCDGGAGNDQVRGGQGNDSVSGGAGNDFVSGDRGDDTVSGGLGADIFHGSQDAGIDKVIDFKLSEGDRVQLDPGTTYTVSQVGADTVISMGGANQMILVGVQMSTLTPGWIFVG